MDEDIIRRRREEWLRTKGGGAKNGPSECHFEWKRKEEMLKSKVDSSPSETVASDHQLPPPQTSPPHAVEPKNEKKRAREQVTEMENEESAQASAVKRSKPEFELSSFGQILDDAFSLVSWNLDGLTEKDLCERTMFFIDMMKKRKPAVIMLQEVTDFSMKFLQRYLSKPYHILAPPKSAEETGQLYPYYNCLLLSKYHWELDGAADCVFFPDSRMGRHIILQKALGKNLTDGQDAFVFGSTHLESLKDPECSHQRVVQTGKVFALMESSLVTDRKAICVVVGGDFNARQAEMNKAKKGFTEIADVWELVGSPSKEQYTWDMMVNDNLRSDGGPAMQARARFDRLYFRKNDQSSCNVTEFKLIGKQRIGLENNMFVSDHWGMAATISLVAT